ncbi:histidine decarboxylase [Bacterioplanes sanyensis]|uniref:Histidine decarboxylase n=1 Tax=Bacterioplanes sanyensis TaxID=1249553 RepID=A0A222FKW0_9GAMM|nr:histidine decarboxylase [Bacterioplanes sanyensis]ASP39001.1 histidine decarboxylase [Bacterioplanes sanyensis]
MPLSYDDSQRLKELYDVCRDHQHQMLGYPVSSDFDYHELWPFLQFAINNVGDWGEVSNYPLNSFAFEGDVIEYFCQLFHSDTDRSWGYVTNGGTEGNMYGCYLAREGFPDGVVYFSKDTHYSVMKIVRFLNIEYCEVASQANGELDYDALEAALNANPTKAPIIFANLGTTMLGAIDDLAQIQQRLQYAGFERDEYYLHADAAFHGLIIPYVDNPPQYSFADGIDSISVSGHKMLGSPIPCGIVLALKEHVDRVSHNIEYIAAADKTLTGSRNGLTPLFLWKFIRSSTEQEKRQRIQRCLALAEKTVQVLNDHKLPAWRNLNSNIVVVPKPSEQIWRKHYLAVAGDVAHIIVAPQTVSDDSRLTQVIDDLVSDKAKEEMAS